jgi:hypothetical protein
MRLWEYWTLGALTLGAWDFWEHGTLEAYDFGSFGLLEFWLNLQEKFIVKKHMVRFFGLQKQKRKR